MGTNAAPNAASSYVPFQPNAFTAFTFQPTFDGAIYNITVTWNYYAQSYFLTCTDLSGTVVYYLPMTSSPDNFGININGGYFDSSLVFRETPQQFEITPANPTVVPLVNPSIPVVTA